MTETRRLGRGLEALLGPISREHAERSGAFRELAVASIKPNPYQPRRSVDETGMAELAASIEASGLLQPIVVRPASGWYELIAGERRWRAVQRLEWEKIPAVVKEVDNRMLLTLALVENLQRDDLSPLDESLGYQRLIQEFDISQVEAARLVGRDRSTVANALRLLRLPSEVQVMVDQGRLSVGHARALLSLADPGDMLRLAQESLARQWSVREIEARVRGGRPARRIGRPVGSLRPGSSDVRRVEEALRKKLGTDVRITTKRRGRGFVTLNFYSNDDLARLLEIILGEPFAG